MAMFIHYAGLFRMMKQFFFLVFFSGIAVAGMLGAQETDNPDAESVQEAPATIIDADNPGMGLLDQATEAKLRVRSVVDLNQVIVLCQRAKKLGLSGENLKYCNQLLASSQLQRGFFLAQSLLNPSNNVPPRDGQLIRQKALDDLETAVTVIKDQPMAYLRIAQLNLLPDGDGEEANNENRAKEALNLAIQCAKDDPVFQLQAVQMLEVLEPEAEKREAVLASAVKNGGNPQIRIRHALTLLELKRDREAQNALQKLIEAEKENTSLQDEIVARLLFAGKHEMAVKILDNLRKQAADERKDEIDQMKAELLYRTNQHEESLPLLNSLIEKLQGSNRELAVSALQLRSLVHLAMDNLDDALRDIEAAQKIRPDFPPILEKKIGILVKQKKFDEALALVKKLQKINSEDPGTSVLEILVLTEMEKYDEAIEIVQNAHKQAPEEPRWIILLFEIYSKQKTYDKALSLAEEQLKKNPEELRWIAAKVQVFSHQKKWEEAVNWLESCLRKVPESQEINLLLVDVLFKKKNYKEAKERMKPLLEKQPDDLMLLFWDSQLSISLGLHHEAVKALTKVVEKDPEDYTSINNLAWILCTSPMDSVRDGRRALELAERAGKLSHYKKAFVLSTLAAAHAEMGDFSKAREWSKKSIELAKMEKDKTEEEQKELLENLQKEWDTFKQDAPYRELMDDGEQ